jgi:hypothetical protein
MNGSERTVLRLTLREWWFVLLAAPTFYLLLVCLVLVGWAIPWKFAGQQVQPPEWMEIAAQTGIGVTCAIWPIYVAWVLLCKRFTWSEKGLWLLIVTWLNAAGMAAFYVFMLRRHLGLEHRPGPRDEAALDRFLTKCGTGRGGLSAGQIDVLRSYCRRRRFEKWNVVATALFAALALYGALAWIPQKTLPMLSDLAPTRLMVVDASGHTFKDDAPDPKTIEQHVQVTMMIGAMAGVLGAMGFFLLLIGASQLMGGWDRRALTDLLKAGHGDHSGRKPDPVAGLEP